MALPVALVIDDDQDMNRMIGNDTEALQGAVGALAGEVAAVPEAARLAVQEPAMDPSWD